MRIRFGAKNETVLTIFAIFEFSCRTSSGNVGRPFSLCTLVNPVCLSASQLPNLLIVPFLNRICGFNFRRGKVQKTKLKYQSHKTELSLIFEKMKVILISRATVVNVSSCKFWLSQNEEGGNNSFYWKISHSKCVDNDDDAANETTRCWAYVRFIALVYNKLLST